MSWQIQSVKNDFKLYEQAFAWYQQFPDFLQHLQNLRGKFGPDEKLDFIKSIDSGINFRADIDKKPAVLVHAEVHPDQTVEGHLFCSPAASVDICAATVSFARVEVLKQYSLVVCHVLRRHRSLVKIMELSGFRDSGLRAWQGVYRGKPQEILYYIAERC